MTTVTTPVPATVTCAPGVTVTHANLSVTTTNSDRPGTGVSWYRALALIGQLTLSGTKTPERYKEVQMNRTVGVKSWHAASDVACLTEP